MATVVAMSVMLLILAAVFFGTVRFVAFIEGVRRSTMLRCGRCDSCGQRLATRDTRPDFDSWADAL